MIFIGPLRDPWDIEHRPSAANSGEPAAQTIAVPLVF
jgi:hypothetical protein